MQARIAKISRARLRGHPLVFRNRPDTVCADEQNGDRGAGARGFTHERRVRRLPREQRQGVHHLRRSNGRQRDHDVHARCLERASAHSRSDGSPDDGARRESGAGHHQRFEKRDLLRADDHSRGKRIAAEENHRAGRTAERLHRDGDAAKGADVCEPGSLGRGRRHERRPPQDGGGRHQAGRRAGVRIRVESETSEED